MCGCVVLSVSDRNQESWRLFVKEHIGKITKLATLFLSYENDGVFGSFFVSQPTVHSGGVKREKVYGCGCWPYWRW